MGRALISARLHWTCVTEPRNQTTTWVGNCDKRTPGEATFRFWVGQRFRGEQMKWPGLTPSQELDPECPYLVT